MLVGRLQRLEEARPRLARTREELPSPLIRLDWRSLERQSREKLASWRSLATRHIADGRKVLGALLRTIVPRLCVEGGHTSRGAGLDGWAPDDDAIRAEHLPDATYGRLLDRAVERLRDKNRTRMASPPGTTPL